MSLIHEAQEVIAETKFHTSIASSVSLSLSSTKCPTVDTISGTIDRDWRGQMDKVQFRQLTRYEGVV